MATASANASASGRRPLWTCERRRGDPFGLERSDDVRGRGNAFPWNSTKFHVESESSLNGAAHSSNVKYDVSVLVELLLELLLAVALELTELLVDAKLVILLGDDIGGSGSLLIFGFGGSGSLLKGLLGSGDVQKDAEAGEEGAEVNVEGGRGRFLARRVCSCWAMKTLSSSVSVMRRGSLEEMDEKEGLGEGTWSAYEYMASGTLRQGLSGRVMALTEGDCDLESIRASVWTRAKMASGQHSDTGGIPRRCCSVDAVIIPSFEASEDSAYDAECFPVPVPAGREVFPEEMAIQKQFRRLCLGEEHLWTVRVLENLHRTPSPDSAPGLVPEYKKMRLRHVSRQTSIISCCQYTSCPLARMTEGHVPPSCNVCVGLTFSEYESRASSSDVM
ncbi:hypothetical protein BC629DRAFT_1437542 [Irpex lacteus]|nr:hypothetical protein BC629DRAFT_1437542 [Irpex lacteus]